MLWRPFSLARALDELDGLRLLILFFRLLRFFFADGGLLFELGLLCLCDLF